MLGRILLGPTPEIRERTVDKALDGLRDQACNTHLAVFMLDAIVLRVFPELGVGGAGAGGMDGMGEMSRSASAAGSLTPPGSIP